MPIQSETSSMSLARTGFGSKWSAVSTRITKSSRAVTGVLLNQSQSLGIDNGYLSALIAQGRLGSVLLNRFRVGQPLYSTDPKMQ